MITGIALENLLAEMSLYDLVIDSHNAMGNCSLKQMMPIYRQMRQDIIEKYDLQKGDFTKYYAYVRARRKLR